MEDKNYDEEKELDRYVLAYYPNLMTQLESLGQKAAFSEEKAQSSNSLAMENKLRDKWGSQNNPEVVAALSEGVDVFRRKVRNRILKEHEKEVFLNRCHKCNKLVKTPMAKMCLWCGYSWRV